MHQPRPSTIQRPSFVLQSPQAQYLPAARASPILQDNIALYIDSTITAGHSNAEDLTLAVPSAVLSEELSSLSS